MGIRPIASQRAKRFCNLKTIKSLKTITGRFRLFHSYPSCPYPFTHFPIIFFILFYRKEWFLEQKKPSPLNKEKRKSFFNFRGTVDTKTSFSLKMYLIRDNTIDKNVDEILF